MANQKNQDHSKSDTRKNIFKRLIQVTMSVIVIAIILLAASGKINWTYAWVYTITSVFVIITNAFILSLELISERGRKKENVEKWDRLLSRLIIIPWLALYIVSGLDIRFGWSSDWLYGFILLV